MKQKAKYSVAGIDLCEIQKIMLDIIKCIDNICKKHNIRYILDGGSMIGAIRHQGFIPWDDDLDIAMPREDYEKFTNIINQELDSHFRFECIENTKEYPYSFGKVRAIQTEFREKFTGHLNISHGIYIDVFPMDYISSNSPIIHKLVTWVLPRLTAFRYRKLGCCGSFWKKILFLIPLSTINYFITKLLKYNYKRKSNDIQLLCYIGPRSPILPASIFEDIIRVPFEDTHLSVPRDYHHILSTRYGDYMSPPPEHHQKPGHIIIKADISQYDYNKF